MESMDDRLLVVSRKGNTGDYECTVQLVAGEPRVKEAGGKGSNGEEGDLGDPVTCMAPAMARHVSPLFVVRGG